MEHVLRHNRRRSPVVHSWTFAALAGLAVLGLLLRARVLGSGVQKNMGLVIVSRALLSGSSMAEPEDLADAERWLRRALAWDDGSEGAHLGLAWALKMRGHEEQATAEWHAAGLTSEHLVSQGDSALRAGFLEEALQWYELLAVVEPELASTVHYLQYSALKAAGYLPSATVRLQQAISVDHGWLLPEMRFRAWYFWGASLHREGREEHAEDALLRAIDGYPEGCQLESLLSESYRVLSSVQCALGKPEQAVPSIEKAMQYDPQNPWMLLHVLQRLSRDYTRTVAQMPFTVWRPRNGMWYVWTPSTELGWDRSLERSLGEAGDVPVGGDLDGDGNMDLLVWQPNSRMWRGLLSSTLYAQDHIFECAWGQEGDIPVRGDLDGDGKMDLVLWRPSNGSWYGLTSSSGYSHDQAFERFWGQEGDLPLAGDLDGDGKVDLVVWRPSNGTWYGLKSSEGYSWEAVLSYQWGQRGDTPLGGDLDGDGKMDLVLWRPSNGSWYGLTSSSGYSHDQAFERLWGEEGDIPVGGDLDGDGRMDLVIWRPRDGLWRGLLSLAGYSSRRIIRVPGGSYGDIPVREAGHVASIEASNEDQR
jgi:tetratricopeptide (TPR) repeat protein